MLLLWHHCAEVTVIAIGKLQDWQQVWGSNCAYSPLGCVYLGSQESTLPIPCHLPSTFLIWHWWVSLAKPVGYPEVSWERSWGNVVFSLLALMFQEVGFQGPKAHWKWRLRANREDTAWGTGLNIRVLTHFSLRNTALSHTVETGVGSGTLCWQWCNAWSWTHLSMSNNMQRNCMGLKITVHSRLGQIRDKVTKIPKYPTTIFKSLEQKLGTAHAPSTQHHQRGGQNT